MSMIGVVVLSPTDIDALNTRLEHFTANWSAYHHPNLQSATAVPDGISWEFKPFNGDEHMPQPPAEMWTDPSVPEQARHLFAEEHRRAFSHWEKAHYARRTTKAVATAETAWAAMKTAGTAMAEAFEALNTTEDNRWRAAVSRLVTAQEQALEAAAAWDSVASSIAFIMADTRKLHWGNEDFERLGVKPEWSIGAASDGTYISQAARHQVSTEIERQRAHLRAIADLVGERS